MSPDSKPFAERLRGRIAVPPPDTPGGAVLAIGFGVGLVYVILLLAQYDAMTAIGWWVTSLSLVAALIGAFALSTMLGNDISAYQRLELDLSRTVLAYIGSGSAPPSDAPLAGVWRAYVVAAEESRRVARAHAYALGPFVAAGTLALAATLLAGLGLVTASQNVIGLGLLVELFAFVLLIVAAGVLLAIVGYSSPVPGYELMAARRWRRNSGRQNAVEAALSEIPWLAEFVRGARETRLRAEGPSMLPGWRA